MNTLKSVAFAIAGMPLMKRLLRLPDSGLTTVLYHGFFFGDEPRQRSRDRLRRQLDWLRRAYRPLTLEQCQRALAAGAFPPRSLLVTADDARVDLLEMHEEFVAFEVPLTVFVCAGWTAQASPSDADGLLASLVTTLQWYAGPDIVVFVGEEVRKVAVDPACRSATIDQILAAPAYYLPHLGELLSEIDQAACVAAPGTICSWSELAWLRERGARFGSHSVSHVRLAAASDIRLNFEIGEARRLIARRLAPCESFAYPFGTEDTFDDRTTAALRAAGTTMAFMTHPGFAGSSSDAFHLPRFVLPDAPMSGAEYRGRVGGAGVFFRAFT